MGIREGLNFSDIFDDSVPADVKPPPDMLGPMKEEDYAIQAKSEFEPHIWEEKLPYHAWYWLDRKGRLYPVPKEIGAYAWAQKFLAANGIQTDEDDAFDKMYAQGFVSVFVGGGIINYQYNSHSKPNDTQIQVLLKASEDSEYHLYDKTKHQISRDAEHNRTYLNENCSGKQLFIEHMMPQDTDAFKSHLAQLFQYLQKELQLKTVPAVKLLSDQKNADKILGKTAYYDPDKKTICLYQTNRHQKDILRSFAHEVIHHWQHENERLKTFSTSTGSGNGKRGESPQSQDPQYAQKDPWLRQMEKQAYLLGNILFRDWEDQKKARNRKSQKTMVESVQRTSADKHMHLSWDRGVINKAMGELGMFNFQNSAKTLCGKRANIKYISNNNPTCPECIAVRKELDFRPPDLE